MTRRKDTLLPADKLAYSPAELAELIGCSKNHVVNQIKNGTLHAIKFGERRWLIPRQAVEALLEGRTWRPWYGDDDAMPGEVADGTA